MNVRLSAIYLSGWLLLFSVLGVHSVCGQSTLIALKTRRDMVFDHAGKYLYITTSNGLVQRYNLGTNQLDRSYKLGGSLNGADISADDSVLIVGQNNLISGKGTVQKLDLNTGAVTNLQYTPEGDEGGGWDVAIDAKGLALITTTGENWGRVRQLNLATNTFTVRYDALDAEGSGGVPQPVFHDVQLRRSADRTRIACFQSRLSNYAIFIYNTDTDKFAPYVEEDENGSPSGASLNRDGSLIGTHLSARLGHTLSLDTVPDFHFVRAFNNIDGDVVFDAVQPLVYGVSTATNEIVAFNTDTLREQFRLGIGEDLPGLWDQFNTGTMVASEDGRHLAIETPSGIRLFTLPQSLPSPSPTPPPSLADRRDMVFDRSGNLYVTTSTGFVMRYNVITKSTEAAYYLGGSLLGVDIAPDDSFLLVCQADSGVREGTIHRLNLGTGEVTNIPSANSWDVVITSNGTALFTTQCNSFNAFLPIYQLNLTNNTVSLRYGMPNLGPAVFRENTHISRSGDYTRAYFVEPNSQNGPVFVYNAGTNAFDLGVQTGRNLDSALGAVNRDGTLIATQFGNTIGLDSIPDFDLKRVVNADSGIAFDQSADIFYAADSRIDQLIAYDTITFKEKFRIDIGENLEPGAPLFGAGNLVTSPDGRYVAIATASGIKTFTVSPLPPPSNPPPPDLKEARGTVFDHAGGRLYVATSSGWVYAFNVHTGDLESSFDIGGSLNGIDIAFDDSFLLIAQAGSGITKAAVQKLDLATGQVNNITYVRQAFEIGSWDVAIAANGLAFVTTQFSDPTGAPLRQIDLNADVATIRNDAPFLYNNGINLVRQTQIHRSADGSRFYFMETEIAHGPMYSYSSVSNSFGPTLLTNGLGGATGAVNRDGSLAATRGYDTSLTSLPDFAYLHTFPGLDGGVAFDAVADLLYGSSSGTSQIVAYDSVTFVEQFRLNIGEPIGPGAKPFGLGDLVASQDGRYLALITLTTVRILDTSVHATPTPTPPPTPTPKPTPPIPPLVSVSVSNTGITEGSDATFTISTSKVMPDPITVSYSMTGKAKQGTDYTLNPSGGTVTIPAGQSSTTILLHSLTDSVAEKFEQATLKLNKGSGYKLLLKKATVMIFDPH